MNTGLSKILFLLQIMALTVSSFCSCSVLKKTSVQDIPEGKYRIPATGEKDFLQMDSVEKKVIPTSIYLLNENDSLIFFPITNSQQPVQKGFIYPLSNGVQEIHLIKTGFDFDIFTTPFKYRPAVNDIPQQFNSNFNGSFYFGYRIDHYKVKKREIYPGVFRENFSKTGFGFGGFIGAGSVFINPKFMDNAIDYEYDALAFDYGIAVLFGVRNFSTGLSLGFDFLTDKNRNNWVYQHQPWIGIFIGLNLN